MTRPHKTLYTLIVVVDLAKLVMSKYGPVSHYQEILAGYMRNLGHEKMEDAGVPPKYHRLLDNLEWVRLSNRNADLLAGQMATRCNSVAHLSPFTSPSDFAQSPLLRGEESQLAFWRNCFPLIYGMTVEELAEKQKEDPWEQQIHGKT